MVGAILASRSIRSLAVSITSATAPGYGFLARASVVIAAGIACR